MPTLTGPITADGALVTVAIGVSEPRRQKLQRFNFPIPAPAQVPSILDPGSPFTLADIDSIQHLGVASYVSQSLRSSASGLAIYMLPVYRLSVTLLDASGQPLKYWPEVDVLGATYAPNAVVHGVFGRDLLADCIFLYDGKAGSFSLTV
jgi:hypothetical protein